MKSSVVTGQRGAWKGEIREDARGRASIFGRVTGAITGVILTVLTLPAMAQAPRPAGPLGPYVFETRSINQRFGFEFGIGATGIPESSYLSLDAPADRTRQYPLMQAGHYLITAPYWGDDIYRRSFGTTVHASLTTTAQPVMRTIDNTLTFVRELRVNKLVLQTDGLWWVVRLNEKTGEVELFRSTPSSSPSQAQVGAGIQFDMKRIYLALLDTPASAWLSEGLENDRHRNVYTNGTIPSLENERGVYRDSFRKLTSPNIDRNYPDGFRVGQLRYYPDRNAGRGEFEISNLLFNGVVVSFRSVEIGPNDFSLSVSGRYSKGIPYEILEGVQQPFSTRQVQHYGVLGKHFGRQLTQTNGQGYQLTPFARGNLPNRAVFHDMWPSPLDTPFRFTN